ncbi:MAG TPA: hypothetical protein VFK86_12325 [Bauldia sp.]|nr:hypothetical protein [Bauldia sp.]
MRLFFGDGRENFQLFSLDQRPDASIYFAAPLFQEIQWHLPGVGPDQNPILITYQVNQPGKLSIHGSGIVHAKPFGVAGSNDFAIRGSMLRSTDGTVLSVRHLLTIFPSEPKHRPNSPAGARKTDGVMTTKQWHPYVIVFWAVPLTRSFTVKVSGAFHADDLEEVPPNGGWGAFNLSMHVIVWFAYRTKHMSRWPHNSQACYSDGHAVPLFIGTGPGQFRLEYRRPEYRLDGDQLSIAL